MAPLAWIVLQIVPLVQEALIIAYPARLLKTCCMEAPATLHVLTERLKEVRLASNVRQTVLRVKSHLITACRVKTRCHCCIIMNALEHVMIIPSRMDRSVRNALTTAPLALAVHHSA